MPTPYDVNGKTPLSAWIPSLDTAGNGTTTLTDLVGLRTGTLVNMDAATDWPADTAAGGVRALDFDGINDLVNCGNLNISGSTQFAFSFWVYLRGPGTSNLGRYFEFGSTNSNFLSAPNTNVTLATSGSPVVIATPILSFNVWHHVMASVSVGSSAVLWIDGVRNLVGTRNPGSGSFVQNSNFILGNRENQVRTLNGRLDDFRIFGQTLDDADSTYFWNGGNGRGIVASSGLLLRVASAHFFTFGF